MARRVLLAPLGFTMTGRKRDMGDMTETGVPQSKAFVSKAAAAVIAALVLATAGQEVIAKRAASFVATDLKTLGGSSSEALAVNSSGVVVGRSFTEFDSAVHAFRWSEHTRMTDLHPDIQPVILKLGFDFQSLAAVIGNDGVIAGFGFLTDDRRNITAFRAFVRTDANGVVDLSEQGTFENSSPTAVNSKGAVVGFGNPLGMNSHAFLWTPQRRVVEDLGTLGGSTSTAHGISDNGIVVGESATKDGPSHAFMWTRRDEMVDLGTLGGFTSSAQAVSDDGVIVGFSQTSEDSDCPLINHAFVWTGRTGRLVDIGPDGPDCVASFAERISGRFVVGHLTRDRVTHGFVWTRKGGLVDIGTLPGDSNSFVTGVNDRGVVVGNSFTIGGVSHAFAWSESSGMVPLTPPGSSSQANAINGNSIVGSIPSCSDSLNCHATLWKPAPRKDRDRDDHDDD